MTSTQRDNVVVVGGGISGVTVAQGLSKKLDHRKFNLILIEPRPFHVWLPAAARMVVTSDEKFAETAVFPFDRVFAKDKGTVRQDKVVSIKTGKGEEAGELELASGETLQYRGEHTSYVRLLLARLILTLPGPALILATGSKWSGPIDLPDSEADFRKCVTQWREKIRAAPDIVIVGGGAVGVELSGEIRDEYPVRRAINVLRLGVDLRV
jgi:NADH dehydrogenase FAD-containing subunit